MPGPSRYRLSRGKSKREVKAKLVAGGPAHLPGRATTLVDCQLSRSANVNDSPEDRRKRLAARPSSPMDDGIQRGFVPAGPSRAASPPAAAREPRAATPPPRAAI
jgi:hypothetical protein